LAAAAVGAAWDAASSRANAATLNLNGANVTLPDGVVFTTPFLIGSNNVTNDGTMPVTPFNGALALFTNPVPIISVAGDPPPFTVANPLPSLANYNVREVSPGQFDLTSALNTAPIGSIVNGLQSAVESVTTGFFEGLNTVFFQGASPFLGAPPR